MARPPPDKDKHVKVKKAWDLAVEKTPRAASAPVERCGFVTDKQLRAKLKTHVGMRCPPQLTRPELLDIALHMDLIDRQQHGMSAPKANKAVKAVTWSSLVKKLDPVAAPVLVGTTWTSKEELLQEINNLLNNASLAAPATVGRATLLQIALKLNLISEECSNAAIEAYLTTMHLKNLLSACNEFRSPNVESDSNKRKASTPLPTT